MTGVALGLLNVTTKLKSPPSVIVASAISTFGAPSSSNMVPIAVSVVVPALIDALTATVNVSSNSSIASTVVGTTTVPVKSPAAITMVTSVVV